MTFEDLLAEVEAQHDQIQEGQLVKGTVVAIKGDHVLVDVGYKSEGAIPLYEFRNEEEEAYSVGSEVTVYIERSENDQGYIDVSKEKADRLRVWDEIAEAYEKDEVVKGTIVARVKGGLHVDIGVKAFLPGSQVDLRPVRNLDRMVGEEYEFKIIKFNRRRPNIVLSRRALLEREREALKTDTMDRLDAGAKLTGIIKNLTDYGAFVDLGGIDGLLHITDMSWGRINHPSQLFNVGDEVDVVVLRYDQDTERVSLGVKQLTADPWDEAKDKYPLGSHVSGKVVSMTDYGAFIEIEPGVEGLVHVTEMSWTRRIKHPSRMVAIGDDVDAMVLDIDLENKRISLGMKQMEENPWQSLTERYPVGTVIQGRVRNITEFGVFVGVEEGIDGLVHISDLSWTHRVKHPSELFDKGDEVEAVVLDIDSENERFSLGIKQLNPDPWSDLAERYPRGAKVEGNVKKLTDYGAFIEIDSGIEGLCHVSEISEERVEKPADVLKLGQTVEVLVIDVDSTERRIGLSIRAVSRAEDGTDYRAYLAGGHQDSSRSTETEDDAATTLGEAFGDVFGKLQSDDD
ncbi:MAG: 30S ribosomal protein S1 [Myxococcota bacterium]|nr:30S ribosomal protein S1 [Myxococcota bacterium]